MRQIPYEHPKAYDPVTLDTPWVSGAATLFRREAFDAVGGFDEAIFMYGEDVDLSWRLRAKGWRLRYQPKLRRGAPHLPGGGRGEAAAGLRRRADEPRACRMRFGGVARIAQGFTMLAGEILAPRSFPGRRARARDGGTEGASCARRISSSRAWRRRSDFRPQFAGWGYETRRDGAFHEFRSRREHPGDPRPKVSILIRTVNRAAWLREALASCANQTYENLEVVVVEDGEAASRAIVDAFRDRLDIRYEATGEKRGPRRAPATARSRSPRASGSTSSTTTTSSSPTTSRCCSAPRSRPARRAPTALAWETKTQVHDRDRAEYDETMHATVHRQPFDRLTLWHHNFLPIQAVLFHRSLYERHGGFAEDMDQLEDWNLWTRYTLEDDFVLVEKTTSKYRVPADTRVAAERQALLDRAYDDAPRAGRTRFASR